ncbi:hypothetical protein [Streptomyces sp. NPDC048638]|uniref:hypothetical protein n=1 Tax=Streptomyces sp. NPDC048638 TaxID=3365580 RepID=UPI003714D3AB
MSRAVSGERRAASACTGSMADGCAVVAAIDPVSVRAFYHPVALMACVASSHSG